MNQRANILFVDEAVFTQRSVLPKVWAKNSEEATMSKEKYGFAAVAVVAAINMDGKVVGLVSSAMSIKKPEFSKLLRQIKKETKRRKAYVFLDNLRTHNSNEITDLANKLNIELLYNASYS